MTDTPLSDDVVERVAEALWRAEWAEGHEPPHSWDAMCSEDWDIAEAFRVQARAALEAARYGEAIDLLTRIVNSSSALALPQDDVNKARALLSSIGASQP